jgi:hypothetical protein
MQKREGIQYLNKTIKLLASYDGRFREGAIAAANIIGRCDSGPQRRWHEYRGLKDQ